MRTVLRIVLQNGGMILIHDLGEIEEKDVPVFANGALRELKNKKELLTMEKIKSMLPGKLGDEIYNLWEEYEARVTVESKIVKALDRIEALIAHNVSDIETFLQREKEMYSVSKWLEEPCAIDPSLYQMAKLIYYSTSRFTDVNNV